MEMIIASPTPKKTHNVSWSPAMTEFLLEYLTEQTKLGKKGPTGFKVAILIQASEAINEKFEKNLVFCNLQYHLKSLKKKWIIIQDLKKLDGVSFNPETRELRMIPEMYQKYVEANPSHTQFINKPIANYEKMEIVFGNNESGANEKLNDDNNTDPKNENEDFEDSQIATPGEESRKRKKPEPNEEGESAKSESNKKAGHIKWSPIMTEFLLNYLAEEVKMGHKGLSSFKGNALSNAAQAVNHKFGKKMTTYHVQNHLKTLKRRWKTIQKLKGMNGVSFNQENNTLEMDFEEYKVYVEKNPLEEQFINKPIKMYAEMEIVCGYENTEENNNNNNNININNKKSIEGTSEVSSPDVNIDAADLGLNVDEMEEIPLLPPANNNNNVEEGKIKKDPDELDTPSINMEIEKTSDTSSSKQPRNISWSPELSEFVLKFLAEQTRMGNKGSNGFKISVINSAAAAINEKFGKKMNFSNVQNHLKTLKRRWRAIQNVKNMNGVVFHQESKVLEMGHEMYQKHLQENPGHEQFINTPIELYDEMEIVCSNSNYDNKAVTCTPIDLCIIETPENEDKEQIDEQTMPLMAIHYNENNLLEPNNAPNNNNNDTICIINTDNSNNLSLNTEVINDDNNNNVDNNVETNMDTNNDINNNDVGANNENNNVIVSNIGENNDNNNKDNRVGEAKMENISSIIGQMAEALKELSTEKLINFAREIMNELRTIEGEFESKTIRLVQRYLVEHTLDGACFLTYNKDEKVAWVKDFVKGHLDGNES